MSKSLEELNCQIVEYLKANCKAGDKPLTAEQLRKALSKIKEIPHTSEPISSELLSVDQTREYTHQLGLTEGDEFYLRISWFFAPTHYPKIAGFVKEIEAIIDAEIQEEARLEAQIDAQVTAYRKSEGELYDDLGQPDFAIFLYADRIEAKAYGPGVGELIPKQNRKYIGSREDIRWQYPLSMEAALRKLGRPVVEIEKLHL